ncbi:uncharacterized protein TNCV_821221 [Trichonephila clavipes]|nr:uncharacterized protein TNCV_821221 [Trichonephila clavipes]
MSSIDINNVLKEHYSVFNGRAKQLTRDSSHVANNASFQIKSSFAVEQFHRVMRVGKHWTNNHGTARETGSGRRKQQKCPSSATARSRKTPYFKTSLELSFSRIMHAHTLQRLFETCSAQQMQLLLWPAYSLDMPSFEHMWDLVSRYRADDLRPAFLEDELWVRITSNMKFASTSRHSKSI